MHLQCSVFLFEYSRTGWEILGNAGVSASSRRIPLNSPGSTDNGGSSGGKPSLGIKRNFSAYVRPTSAGRQPQSRSDNKMATNSRSAARTTKNNEEHRNLVRMVSSKSEWRMTKNPRLYYFFGHYICELIN